MGHFPKPSRAVIYLYVAFDRQPCAHIRTSVSSLTVPPAFYATISGRASLQHPAFLRILRRIWRVVNQFSLKIALALTPSCSNATDAALAFTNCHPTLFLFAQQVFTSRPNPCHTLRSCPLLATRSLFWVSGHMTKRFCFPVGNNSLRSNLRI